MIYQHMIRTYFLKPNIFRSIQTSYRLISSYSKMAEQVYDNDKFTGIRLPTNVTPVHYDLSLKTDLVNFTFDGTAKIQYKSASTKKEIILHSLDLDIADGHLNEDNPLVKVTYSKDSETATLEFKNQDDANSGTLFLRFKGTLNDKMKGFYRTAINTKKGDTTETIYGATTQFEATDARRCFPCWDEPALKATFSVSITYQPSDRYTLIALSNTPAINESKKGNEIEVQFAKTPIMSTYLLAFVVGPFDYIEQDCSGRKVRVYTIPGKTEQGRFALDVACKSLEFYEDYFAIKYPLEKMDLIAIPDFLMGAMENWGLVTYRETCLLVDPANTTTRRRQNAAIIVAHEIAHQWFGNLVTMEWWTHLWLNEGFASFMEHYCVDRIFPEFDLWEQFVSGHYHDALSLDALNNSHPIEVPVGRSSEVDEIFDDISYSKGASVIRMLHKYIGDECFRKGLNQYLSKFAYKNAVTEDLWDSLEAASNKPVRRVMTGWTSQKGFPWLSTTYSPTEEGKGQLSLVQSKFTVDGKLSKEDSQLSWSVPVAVISSSDTKKVVDLGLLDAKKGVYKIDCPSDGWFKLNPGSVGLYRTVHPEDISRKLGLAVLDQTLLPLDRLGLHSDFFALCQAGKVGTVELLKLLENFKGETNYNVWLSIDGCVGKLNTLFANSGFQDKLHSFGRRLYSSIFEKLTWSVKESENQSEAMTRALVIRRLVLMRDESVISEAQRRYKAHLDKTSAIPADLRTAVYRAVSNSDDEDAFNKLFEIYRTTDLSEEKNRVADALSSTNNLDRLKRVVDFIMSNEIRIQDKVLAIMSIGHNKPQVAWQLLQDKKDYIREKYSGHLLCRLVSSCTQNFSAEEKAQEVAKFFELNKFTGTERAIQQSLENIRLNANWLARDNESVKAFLASGGD